MILLIPSTFLIDFSGNHQLDGILMELKQEGAYM